MKEKINGITILFLILYMALCSLYMASGIYDIVVKRDLVWGILGTFVGGMTLLGVAVWLIASLPTKYRTYAIYYSTEKVVNDNFKIMTYKIKRVRAKSRKQAMAKMERKKKRVTCVIECYPIIK